MTDYCDRAVRAAPGHIVGGVERSSPDGRHAEYVEEATTGDQDVDRLHLAPFGEIQTLKRPGKRTIERSATLTKLVPHAEAPSGAALEAVAECRIRRDRDERLRLLHWQRPQCQSVCDREDRCSRAYSKSERQYRGDRHRWGSSKGSSCKPQIAGNAPEHGRIFSSIVNIFNRQVVFVANIAC